MQIALLIVQILTLLALVFYTTATFRMARDTKRMADAEHERQESLIRPMVTIACPEEGEYTSWKMINVGQGVALRTSAKIHMQLGQSNSTGGKLIYMPNEEFPYAISPQNDWEIILIRYQDAWQRWFLTEIKRGQEAIVKGPMLERPDIDTRPQS